MARKDEFKDEFTVEVHYKVHAVSYDAAFQMAKDFTVNNGSSLSGPLASWSANSGAIISVKK